MRLFLLLLLMVTLPSTEAALPSTCLMTRKPEFTGAPRVKQTSLNSVRVSWDDDLVSNMDCAKQFKVMWWVEGTSPPRQQSSAVISGGQFNYTVQNLAERTNYVVKVVAHDKSIIGAHWHDSPLARFTTSPQDCSHFTEDLLPHPRFLLLGPTGVGKSTLGNLLLGGNVHGNLPGEMPFRMGHGARAQTTNITHQVGNWLGYGPCFTIIDTPGTSDGEGRDYKNAIDMANIMNKKFKTIDVFLLLSIGQWSRFDQSMIDLLLLYQSIFGGGMWSNSVTEVTHWKHSRRDLRARTRKNQTDESRHIQWNEMYHEKLKIPIDEVPSVYIDPMYPIFSEDEFDIEEMERDPEERRLFDWYTDLLWDIATTTPPFACYGKCEAPSGYFIGEPWMAISSSQEKKENETSLAVRTGEKVGLSCRIWIGGNSATKFTTENVTITVEGTEIYKKETDPNTGVKRETHRDQDPRFKIHVREERSASGHSSEFKISIDSFGEDMVGNVTCENGVASNNSAVALVHRVDCSYGNWSTWSTCSRSCLASDGIQGQKMRNRTSFPPQNGGDPCTASLTDTTVCAGDEDEIIMCPVDRSWTSWSDWSPCSPKCGLGKQDRSRSCTQGRHGGTQCPQLLTNLVEKDTKRCKIKECPACNVEEWQKWSPCTTAGLGNLVFC